MAREKPLTDEQMEQEIARLEKSSYVQLAEQEQRIIRRRKQRLYNLRWLEKRGRKLAGEGVTMESLKEHLAMLDDSYFENEKGDTV